MAVLLHVDSSPMGEASVSRSLTEEFVRNWRRANPQGRVITRDLAATAIPVIDAAWVAANFTPKESRTPQQNQILALSTEFTTELLNADEYIIGLPVHNWGPAASMKLWADQIVRFGETLAVTPSGPRGTLDQKRATFVIAAGTVYDPGAVNAVRSVVEPWLRKLFSYLGVKNMQFILADGAAEVRYGRIDKATFLAPHMEAIQALFAQTMTS
jgi:FMN-dependent NADH-azoreductase